MVTLVCRSSHMRLRNTSAVRPGDTGSMLTRFQRPQPILDPVACSGGGPGVGRQSVPGRTQGRWLHERFGATVVRGPATSDDRACAAAINLPIWTARQVCAEADISREGALSRRDRVLPMDTSETKTPQNPRVC